MPQQTEDGHKGGRLVHAVGPVEQPDCVGVESRGRGAGPADCAEFVFPLYSFLFCHL